MNPASITGIRHYEPLFLSRRPKPEAFELMKLIREYGDPIASARRIRMNHPVVELDKNGQGNMTFSVENATSQALDLTATLETPSCVPLTGASLISKSSARLKPGTTQEFKASIKAPTQNPGFYHVFLRMDEKRPDGNALMTYGWGEARMRGVPSLDSAMTTYTTYLGSMHSISRRLESDTSMTVVYGAEAPPLELESAVLIHNTLESATGREIHLHNTTTLPQNLRDASLVLVGTADSNPMIRRPDSIMPRKESPGAVALSGENQIIVTGRDPEGVAEAAADFALRYWRNAKDSMVRRLDTLTEKSLPKGADASKLP
jgi:hypothetical protein